MNLRNEVEKRSAALPSSQLRRPEGRGTPEQTPPYPIWENVPKRTASTLNEPPQHPAMLHRPTGPADLQTDWQKPPERRNAETSPHSSKRPTDAGRTWFAKRLPLLVGAVGLGTILLLLHMIHILF